MKIETIYSIERLISYKNEWENILEEISNDIMFLEPDWIINWWKLFGYKHKLFVLIAINDQEIAGICPLMTTGKRGCNEIGFIGGRESSEMDFILRDKYREEALEYICNFLRHLKGNNIIKFHGVSERSTNYALLEKYLQAEKIPFAYNSRIFYYLNLKSSDFNTHFEHRFGKKSRQTMSNKEKKLKRLGSLIYKRISPSEMDEVFEIHEKRWLRKVGNSSFSKGKTREFYKELALNKNMKFDTAVDAITLNNKIISFMYGFKHKKKYLFIRIAHNDDFYFLSPGELVFKKKIEECYFSQISVINFGAGYEPYKAKWTDDYEKLFTILLPSGNLQSVLTFFIKYWAVMKLKDALKNNKRINNLRRYSLGRLKFLLSNENISSEILKIKRAVDQYGLKVFIKKNLIDLAGKIFSYKKYLLLEKELNRAEIPEGELHVREATIDDLDELSEVMNEAANRIVRRLANKNKCFITLFEHEIIHYCWINCSNIEIASIKLDIPLQNTDVYIYDTFMKKEYRNENNYSYVFSGIFNLLYERNFRNCYITLNSSNKSSENEILRRMFNPVYKIIEKKILNKVKHSIIDPVSSHQRNESNEN